MSSYVEIRSSVADILVIAHQLRLDGQSLTSAMEGRIDAVTSLEAAPGTLPRDEFTNGFLETYHKPVDGGPMNEVVKAAVPKLGVAMDQLGKYVADAMWSYTGTDDDNATDIDQAGGRH